MTESGNARLSYQKNQVLENPTSLRHYLQRRKPYLMLKRSFDILFSLAVIILLLSWLFPIIAILVKISSRGPVLFMQRRVGFLGRSFDCYKFRTMVVNREAHLVQATRNDPRITPIGRVLRVTNLDELPQFINVLLGHMTIVGPRPHMFNDCREFSKVVENYKLRNLVKPGITGLAQVKGYRGPAKDYESIFRRYQWDAFYVRNANFWLDLRIVRRTAAQTFTHVVKIVAQPPAPPVTASERVDIHWGRKLVMAFRERMNSLF